MIAGCCLSLLALPCLLLWFCLGGCGDERRQEGERADEEGGRCIVVKKRKPCLSLFFFSAPPSDARCCCRFGWVGKHLRGYNYGWPLCEHNRDEGRNRPCVNLGFMNRELVLRRVRSSFSPSGDETTKRRNGRGMKHLSAGGERRAAEEHADVEKSHLIAVPKTIGGNWFGAELNLRRW